MKYLLIRHGLTDANRETRILYGKQGAPLNETGKMQAQTLHKLLLEKGIDLDQPIAVADYLRTKQTAEVAGFKNKVINPSLNEINSSDPNLTSVLAKQNKVTIEAQKAADNIIKNPPSQKIWVTHGLVIAALLVSLGKSDPDNFFPDYCSITEIEI